MTHAQSLSTTGDSSLVELTGLPTTSPIGYMAAIGLVRVLYEDCELDVKLGWQGGHAVLDGIREDALIAALLNHMVDRHQAPEWNWNHSTRGVTPEQYNQTVADLSGDGRALSFLAAFATDAVITQKGSVGNTRLDLTSGQQALIRNLRDVAKALAQSEKAEASFRSTLFGGAYEDQHAFGWDPAAVLNHAHQAIAPTRMKKAGKAAMVWLAAESLALHPLFPGPGRVATPGVQRMDNATVYHWSVWQGVVGLPTIRALRLLDLFSARQVPGITEQWISVIGSSGKYGAMLPARRVR